MKGALLSVVAALVILIGATGASAATYNVVACSDATNLANNSWVASNSTPAKLETGYACGGSGAYGGIHVRDVLDVANTPSSANATWTFSAPAGTAISAMSYQRWIFKEDDDDWTPALAVDGTVVETCSITYPAIDCNLGWPGGQRTNLTLSGATSLALGVLCRAPVGVTCGNGAIGHHKVSAVLYGATVTLSDPSAPVVSNVGGSLLAGGYLTDSRGAAFDASDNTGIRSGRLYVDGSVRASSTYTCDFTYAVPCSNKSGAQLSLDTRSLSDGSHTVQVAATDPAGNEAKSSSRTILVDNNAPSVPQQLGVVGGDDWRTTNSFSVSWTNPVDSGSAVAVAHYQVCAPDNSQCQPAQQLAGADVSRIDNLSVPAEGGWGLRVWLEDAAGNVDSANTGSVVLRYGSPPVTSTPPTDSTPSDTSSNPAPSEEPAPSDTGTPTSPLVDVTTTLTASPSPQPSILRRDPGLRLTTARLSRNRLIIRGRVASGSAKRLVFTVRSHSGRLVRRSVLIRTQRFAVSLKVRAPRGARLTARFTGDAAFRPASTSVRIRR